MKIAFFSTWHGHGTTTNSIVTAINLAMNYNAKVLLTHNQYIQSNMEEAFFAKQNSDNILDFNDIGIDSIERLAKSRQLKPEDFSDYALSIIDNRLDLLIGSQKTNKNLFSNDMNETILEVLRRADEYYDFVIIDVNSEKNDITKRIIDNCDFIVYNVDQNEKIIKDFFERDIKELDRQKLILLISKYDKNIKCSPRYIKNNFKWKDEIYKVNYSSKLVDSINNHSVLKFFYACNRRENEFFKDLNLLSQRIVNIGKNKVLESKIQKQPFFNNLGGLKSFFKFG